MERGTGGRSVVVDVEGSMGAWCLREIWAAWDSKDGRGARGVHGAAGSGEAAACDEVRESADYVKSATLRVVGWAGHGRGAAARFV